MSHNPTSRSFLRKLDPKVYEVAAESVKAGKTLFSCIAIFKQWAHPGDGKAHDHLQAYNRFFSPYTAGKTDAQHPFWNRGNNCLNKPYPARSFRRHKAQRVMALLMMASIVRAARE